MTENRQFKIVNDCGDYHLMNGDERLGYDLCSPAMRKANWNNVVDKLNEQDSRINYLELKLERERCYTKKQYDKWLDESETRIKELEKENKLKLNDVINEKNVSK